MRADGIEVLRVLVCKFTKFCRTVVYFNTFTCFLGDKVCSLSNLFFSCFLHSFLSFLFFDKDIAFRSMHKWLGMGWSKCGLGARGGRGLLACLKSTDEGIKMTGCNFRPAVFEIGLKHIWCRCAHHFQLYIWTWMPLYLQIIGLWMLLFLLLLKLVLLVLKI